MPTLFTPYKPKKTNDEETKEIARILGAACGCLVLTWLGYLGLCALLAAGVAFAFGVPFIKAFVILVVVTIVLNILVGIVKK